MDRIFILLKDKVVQIPEHFIGLPESHASLGFDNHIIRCVSLFKL